MNTLIGLVPNRVLAVEAAQFPCPAGLEKLLLLSFGELGALLTAALIFCLKITDIETQSYKCCTRNQQGWLERDS